jgi:hypothetical protein
MDKRCNKCQTDKDVAEFYKDINKVDGLRTICKDCVYENNKKYYENNPDKVRERDKKWVSNNREYCNLRSRERYKNNILERIKKNLRNRLVVAIKNRYNDTSAVKDLGCSIEELKLHLESKFESGMSWDNWSRDGWHIDHIVPLSSTNNEEELKILCHYTNLQPLWAKDNLSKGSKIWTRDAHDN